MSCKFIVFLSFAALLCLEVVKTHVCVWVEGDSANFVVVVFFDIDDD